MKVRYELRCKECGHEFIVTSDELIDENINKGEFIVECPDCEGTGTEKNFLILNQREI